MKSSNNEKRVSILRRTAKEIKNYKVTMKILRAALIMMVIVLIVMYIFAVFYKRSGSFTVSLDKYDMVDYGLTLSESREMRYPTSHLNAKIVKDMTNIAEEWLPENIDMIDGEHNGDNYLAYTFYLQNAGEVAVSYEYSLEISNITNGLDEAIRVRLYKDGESCTYAKTKSNGGGAEPGTKEFYSSTSVAKERVEAFEAKSVTKFTIVVWIEGNDPDCIDWLIGGQLKLEMDMSIVH